MRTSETGLGSLGDAGQLPFGTRSCRMYTGAMILEPPTMPKSGKVKVRLLGRAVGLQNWLVSPLRTVYASPLTTDKNGPRSHFHTSSGQMVSVETAVMVYKGFDCSNVAGLKGCAVGKSHESLRW